MNQAKKLRRAAQFFLPDLIVKFGKIKFGMIFPNLTIK
jgi:hypothetical protein